MHDESVWTMEKYVAFVNRNRELYDKVVEEEINPLHISVKKDGKRNTPCMSKVLRESMDDVIEFNACNKADDYKGKKEEEELVDYIHQRSGGESKLRMDLCETGEADLQKWTWRN
jgi:hypothetical protein